LGWGRWERGRDRRRLGWRKRGEEIRMEEEYKQKKRKSIV
jgi:hypothetical protein